MMCHIIFLHMIQIKRVMILQYEGYLIDLDGTMYRGNESIEGAKEFITNLQKQSIPHLFITNNSTSTRHSVVNKLARFGIHTTKEQILTSAIAAANYIQANHQGKRIYMIGEEGLQDALAQSGLTITAEDSDYVVVGLDRELTYEKLAKACLLIRNGAKFISTNKDRAIPTDKGLIPGNGSITTLVEVSSGVKPIYIGKPEHIMMQQALQYLKLPKEKVLMVGDNYETDILFGIHANVDTLMVLTGFSSKEDLLHVGLQPTYVEENLMNWLLK